MTHESMAKRLIKVGVWGGGLIVSYKAGSDAFWYRPLGDDSEISATRRYQLDAIHDGTQARGIDLKDGNPWGWIVARATTMALGAAICKTVMSVGNQTKIFRDEKHERWLGLVREREDGVPLITVSNHESCFDDPGVMSVIVPWDVVANPKKMRWGICTQDICFPNNSFIQAVAGAGQALPIKRGGGIDQPLFLDVARHVAAGHWVHVFPEGRVIQTGELGLDVLTPRGPRDLERVGRLKWGVGKLIAHSPCVPVVIPMHHTGMPNVMPQHNIWRPDKHNGWWFDNRPLSVIPNLGNEVRVRFGNEVIVEDLLKEHERKHGALRKISWKPEDLQDSYQLWVSTTSAERQLYSAITQRVQEALLKLEKEAKAAES